MSDRSWFEDEQLWRDLAPLLFTRRKRERAAGEVDALVRLLNLPADSSILDIPCGIGRHSIELARRGYRVTGIDRTQAFLEEAIASARQQSLAVDLRYGDMRHFACNREYDTVICLWNSFGYFPTRSDDAATLANF